VLQGHLLVSKQMLLVGPGGSIEKGSFDHVVVSLGVCFRFSEGNVGEKASVTATDAVTLGPPNGAILHGLEPGGIAHLLTAPLLFEVWHHALQVSIGRHEVQHFLLSVQVVGTVGIQIHIEITHEDWGTSMGRVLIKSSLDMGMEVIQSFLFWKEASPKDGHLANSGATQTADTIVSMLLNIFQVKWRGLAVPWVADRDGNATLIARVGFCSMDIVSFKVSRVNDTFRVGISLLPSEAGAGEDGKANVEGFEIQQSLPEPAVASASKVPNAPMGEFESHSLPIENTLEECLLA